MADQLQDHRAVARTRDLGVIGVRRGPGRRDRAQRTRRETELASQKGGERIRACAGKAGTIQFVGFDASAKLVEALKNDQIHALVIQNPVRMGYLGVKTMVAHLKGEKVEPRVDTGVAVVTKANMNDPSAKEVLEPDLSILK